MAAGITRGGTALTAPYEHADGWPRSPHDFVDTTLCPSCFAPIIAPETGPVTTCTTCGLPLTDDRLAEVLRLGRLTLERELSRRELLQRIRTDQARTTTSGDAITDPHGIPRDAPHDRAGASSPSGPPVPAWATGATVFPRAADTQPLVEPATAPHPPVGSTPSRVAASIGMAAEASEPPSATVPPTAAAAHAAPSHAAPSHAARATTPTPSFAPPTLPPSPSAAAQRPDPRRSRLSVPALLLIVGVCLVGVAAIFFLTVAWFVATLPVRALIVGAITITTLVTASLLRRRRLTATAEAVAVIGVILLALDAWAIPANGLFGADAVDPVIYAGAATLGLAALLRLWARLSALRAPDIASVLALPTGVALLAGGVVDLSPGGAVVVAFAGAAAGALTHGLPSPWSAARTDATAERTALAAIGAGSLTIALAASPFVALDSPAFAATIPLVIVALAAAHIRLLRRPAATDPIAWAAALSTVTASVAAVAAATLGWQLALRDPNPTMVLLVAPVVAALVAVISDRWGARIDMPRVATGTAGLVAVASIATAAVAATATAMTTLASWWHPWTTDALSTPPVAGAFAPLIAAAMIVALTTLAPTLDAGRPRFVRDLGGTALLLAGAVHTGIPLIATLVSTTIAIASTLLALRERPAGRGSAVHRIAPALLAAAVGYSCGIVSTWLWAVGVVVALVVLALLAASRRLDPQTRAVFAAVTVTVAALTAVIVPTAIATTIGTSSGIVAAGFALLQWVAVASLALDLTLRRIAPAAPSIARALGAAGLTVAAVSLVEALALALPGWTVAYGSGLVADAVGEPVAGVVRAVLLIAVLVALTAQRDSATAERDAPTTDAGTDHDPSAPTRAPANPRRTAVGAIAAGAMLTPALGVLVLALTATLDMPRLTPIVALSAFALVPVAGAVRILAGRASHHVADVRLGADAAAVTALVLVAWTTPSAQRWLALALFAVALAAVSACRGWAAPRTLALPGVPTTHRDGVPTVAAPRRVGAWIAFGFAVAALWWALTDAAAPGIRPPLEAYTLAPAVGLLVFAGALTWLRRHTESAIAVVLAITLGLGSGAAWPGEDEPARTIVSTVVAGAIVIASAWTPVRRTGAAAAAAAWSASVVAIISAAQMSLWDDARGAAWLAVPVTAAFVAAAGFARRRAAHVENAVHVESPAHVENAVHVGSAAPVANAAHVDTAAHVDSPAQVDSPAHVDSPAQVGRRGTLIGRGFTVAGPAVALAASALVGAALASRAGDAGAGVTVGAIVFAVLLLAHVCAGAIGRVPFAETTRWTAIVGAAVIAQQFIEGAPAIEVLSLPIAVALLAAAAASIRRTARGTLAAQRPVDAVSWVLGLVIGVTPSVLAPDDAARTWLVVAACVLAAAGLVLADVPRTARLTTVSTGVLVAGALIMGLRSALGEGEAGLTPAIVAGVGAVVVGALTVAQRRFAPAVSMTLALSGPGVIAVLVGLRSDGSFVQTASLGAGAAVVAVGAAAFVARPAWRRFAAVVSTGATAVLLIAVAVRFALLLRDAPTAEADLWVAAAVVVTIAIGLVAGRAAAIRLASAMYTTAAAAFALATASLLVTWTTGGGIRTAYAVAALSVGAALAWRMRARLHHTPAVAASVGTVAVALIAVAFGAARPIELVTFAPAAALVAVGADRLRRDAQARSWPTLGGGLTLATVPSLLHDFGPNDLWRIVALGLVAIALVVIGAAARLQAPLVVGVAVLLVHGVAQLWPWLTALYVATPWWLWVGIGGVLLIVIAARYEQQRRAVRKTYDAVTSLR